MSIIYSDKGNFLLLKMNPKWLKQKGWFVVTGNVEKESIEECVIREVKEETGLNIISLKPADYSCEYEWPKGSGKMHHETVFLVKVKEQSVKLSGEHLQYKWLDKEDFLELIDWWGNVEELKRIIKNAK